MQGEGRPRVRPDAPVRCLRMSERRNGMRDPFLALSCTVAAILALQSPIQAQTADSPLPVSMERIRAGLTHRASALQVPLRPNEAPTFRIEIRQQVVVPPAVDEQPFDPTF